ncbi:MAG TPA: tetratricopeptide repeat protein [Polyangiaceae bacterium]|nr:tetratricopeptide repeat protein [Polyangiaceae bacterium]
MFRSRLWLRNAPAAALLVLLACDRDPPAPAVQASATPVRCARGAVDPPRAESQPAERLLRDQKYAEARKAFDALAAKYPESSNLLVWRGDADLNDDQDYLGSAERALGFYRRARELDRQGCTLSEIGRYYTSLHSAFAHLRRDDAAQALSELGALAETYPDSAEIQYNLSRAHCLQKKVSECYTHFAKTLELARARTRPKFQRTHYAVADWIRRSETQSELAPLRSDPRYTALVKQMISEP